MKSKPSLSFIQNLSLIYSQYGHMNLLLPLTSLIVYVMLELDSLDASRLDPSLALAFYFKDRSVISLFII